MSEYDGSWDNDPLDLRCIRLDAELEEIYGRADEDNTQWKPKNLQELYRIRAEDPDLFRALYAWGIMPPHRLGKQMLCCYVLDKDYNIVGEKCHDPYVALETIQELGNEDSKILVIKTLKEISIEEAQSYE